MLEPVKKLMARRWLSFGHLASSPGLALALLASLSGLPRLWNSGCRGSAQPAEEVLSPPGSGRQGGGPGPLPWLQEVAQGPVECGLSGRSPEHFLTRALPLAQVFGPTGSPGSLGSAWAVPDVLLG